MKQYKLIQEYPGSPKYGTTVKFQDDFYMDINNEDYEYSPNIIENNPKYWGEIVDYPIGTKLRDTILASSWKNIIKTEKGWEAEQASIIPLYIRNEEIGDGKRFEIIKEQAKPTYQILELRCKNHNDPYLLGENGLYGFKDFNFPIEKVVFNSKFEDVIRFFPIIWSIKRLSDGEIFTVGDYFSYNKTLSTSFKIKEITIDPKIGLIIRGEGNYTASKASAFSKIVKAKRKKLFTTEDGVDIFEGDKYFAINSNCKEGELSYFFIWDCDTKDKYNSSYKHSWMKCYSTREAANQYIEWNKPIFSRRDLMDFNFQLYNPSDREKYDKFIKEKLGKIG